MSYTKGKWVIDDREDLAGKFYSDDATGSIIGECQHYYLAPRSLDERKANAKRIVYCVNACDGIENPAYEIARLRENVALLINHLESCAKELTLINQTPWEAIRLIEKMKVK